MFDTRYMEQITAVEKHFLARFGIMPTVIERYKTHNYFLTEDRSGWFGYKWYKYITTGGESKVIKTPYGNTLSTGSEADSKITNEKCKVIDELRDAYSALNKYQKERVSRTAGSGEPDDATNAVIEFLKDLLTYLSTIEDEKLLVTGLQQTQAFINDIIIHPGRGDGKGLFPTTDNKLGINVHSYNFKGALGDAWSHLRFAEEHLDLLSKEVEINRLFSEVKEANRTLLKLMLRHATVIMRDVHNQCYAEIINVNSLRDANKADNQSFIHTESGKLARLTALCPAHRFNFPEDRAGLKTGIDAPLSTPVLSKFLEASLLECGFVKIRRATDQDDRHQHKQFEIYFVDEPDNFKICIDGQEYSFNLMNGNSGIFKVFAKDRELQKLYRVYFAIQQQISKCQMAIAVGSSLASKNGESTFRIALDQHTHHLCNILQFYYDTSLQVINLIVNQCRAAQRAYTTQSSYVPFTKLVKDRKIALPYVNGNVFHDNECVVDLIKGVSDKEFAAWFNNFNSLQTCENDILKHLKNLKSLVAKIDGICIEGMSAAEQAKIRQQTQVYAAMAVKLAEEHNSQNHPEIEARNPGAMPKLTLEETRDLGETAESAFVMLLVLAFNDASRAKIASKIGSHNDIESIARELINGRNFNRHPDLLDESIPIKNYREEPLTEFNFAWWILKVYIAGIKPRSNTTDAIRNKFIEHINNNLLYSPKFNYEHILLIGCSLASIGTQDAREKLQLVYALLKRRAEEYKTLYERSEDIDKPEVRKTLVLINLYRSLIGLSLRDCSVAKFPVTFKHWCIDTDQSLQAINFCEDDVQDRLNDLLLNIRPMCGTHLINLLKKKYHGNAVARVDHMNTLPAPKGVANAPVPPQPKAPPAAAAKPAAAIVRENSQPRIAEDEDDVLVHLVNQSRGYATKSKNGTLTAQEAEEWERLNKVIKNIKAQRLAEASAEEAPAPVSRPSSRGGSGQSSRQGSNRPSPPSEQQVTPLLPPGSILPTVPPAQPTSPAPATDQQASMDEAARQRLGYLAAASGAAFFAPMVMPQTQPPVPAAAPPATPALSRVPSEASLSSPPVPPTPALTDSLRNFGRATANRGSPAALQPSASSSSLFAADPDRPWFNTVNSRRDSEALPPGTVPAHSGTGPNILRLSARPAPGGK